MDPSKEMIADVVKLPGVVFEDNEPVHFDVEHQLACKGGGVYRCFFIGRAVKPAGASDGLVRVRFVSAIRQVKPTDDDAPSFKPIPSSTITFTVPPGGTVLPPGWNATQINPPSVAMLELKEFCYSATLMEEVNHRVSVRQDTLIRWRKNMRDLLRCHRFDVLAWLMQQGVQIPEALLSDRTHPQVGDQSPDRPATVAPPAS